MRRLLVHAALLIAAAFALSPSFAAAQATRTWVSGVGDDANPCSRTAPCKTFAGSISKTAAGGEINCLDPGGFGTLTITKSISIYCDSILGSVLASGTAGFTISDSGAGNIVVVLSGLDIDGAGTTIGTNGINVISAKSVSIRNSYIRNFSNAGINVAPSAGSVKVVVNNVTVNNAGTSNTTGGILVKPTGAASVVAMISGSQVQNGTQGIRFDSSGGTGTVTGFVRDSVVTSNVNNGVGVVAGSSSDTVYVVNTSVQANNYGLVVNGSGATIYASGDNVTGNLIQGLFVNGSGTINSYKNNNVNANTTDGTFTAQITPQ